MEFTIVAWLIIMKAKTKTLYKSVGILTIFVSYIKHAVYKMNHCKIIKISLSLW